jgi:hypothetical protein
MTTRGEFIAAAGVALGAGIAAGTSASESWRGL